MCKAQLDSLAAYKEHLWEDHSNLQAQSKHGQPVEQLIGKMYLARFRKKLFKMIRSGRFEQVIEDISEKMTGVEHANVAKDGYIELDDDPVRRQKRLNLYLKKREMLVKLADCLSERTPDIF